MRLDSKPLVFMGRDSTFECGDLVWWLPRTEQAPMGWFDLAGHACDGVKLDYLDGWVFPLEPSPAGLQIIDDIANEAFAECCDVTSLDYEVNEQHRAAYVNFLALRGLEAGDLSGLVQAVYPLAATKSNLQTLGVECQEVPHDAKLLVLGTNCD
ncbi:hypothetical protein [Chromobacterium haemolyticum]|uniref:hypothetical protein n=1 Tax=Chromobacterium haemolyticum TaxID=394935 RepID=UPI00244AFB91|nr:hypothetical protein [Chromobacterium haemolyticum]MDH0342074.1 hypothetical protein [Chromobacterium haemolyticum]